MDDIGAQVEAILEDHRAREAKRKAAEDPADAMHKTIRAVFALVERQQELDSGSVEIKAYEC